MLDTNRLHFEPLGCQHAAGLIEPFSDSRIYAYIGGGPPLDVADLAADFARRAAGPPDKDERWLNFAVSLRSSGEWIGRLEATIIDQRGEVAYLLGPNHWGQGFATEAVRALHDHLWRNWNVCQCWATTSPQNLRSIRLLRRLDYQPSDSWPDLGSYDPGDLVFVRQLPAVLA